MTMNQYTVGQTLYKASFGYRGELKFERAVVARVTAKTVTLSRHPDDNSSICEGRYALNADTGLVAGSRFYHAPAYATPSAAMQALLDDLQAKEASLQKKIIEAQGRIEVVAAKLEEETTK